MFHKFFLSLLPHKTSNLSDSMQVVNLFRSILKAVDWPFNFQAADGYKPVSSQVLSLV